MESPLVTIVVVPRERFSYTRESLESIYDQTDYPFNLVYVDGGSSPGIKRYLKAQAQQKQFKLIRTDHYISPNRARNLGLSEVKTKYVVFIDNDVVVKSGWLKALVQCAEETGAGVVGTLTCLDKPLHEVIHNGGGETHFVLKSKGVRTERRIIQNSYLEGRRVSKIPEQLHRTQCEFVELHCALARTELFEHTGPFDEGLLSTREHIDICLLATQAGYPVYCERQSIVTYITGPKFDWWDVTFFMLRWSNAWDIASFSHFREKWNLVEDNYFERRYNRLGRRRYRALLRAVISRFPFKEHRHWFADVLKSVENRLNGYISDSYAQKHSYARHSFGLRKEVKEKELPTPLVTASLKTNN
jgi:GT2 family glycosyltransferase